MSALVFNLLVAHCIADFYLQCKWLCDKKVNEKFPWLYNVLHALLVFGVSWLLVFTLNAWWLVGGIAISHLFVDVIKTRLEKRYAGHKQWLSVLFFIDQILHIVAIVVMSYLWLRSNAWSQFEWIRSIDIKYLLLIVAVLLAHKPSNIAIKQILKFYEVKVPENGSAQTTDSQNTQRDENHSPDNQQIPNLQSVTDNADDDHGLFRSGSLIGSMERVLMIVLVVLSQYEAIGFLITAKSILRFSESSGSEKSEYVVAGTFLSFAIALALGLLVIKMSNYTNLFF